MNDLANDVGRRLSDAEPEVRRLATHDLTRLSAPECCDLLLVALADADWRVRKEAAIVAPRLDPRIEVVFAVAGALGERDDVGLRNAAVEALIAIGPDAVPGAIDALARLDADGRKLAVEVLAGAPSLSGMRALAGALRDADANVVIAAAEGLGRAHLAGQEARELARDALSELLVAGSISEKLAALEALVHLGEHVPWALLEPLVSEPLLRRAALSAAGGTRTPRALRVLAESCADRNPTVARDAVMALGRSIEEVWDADDLLEIVARTLRASEPAHERLRSFSRTGDSDVRAAAILGLGLVRDPDDVALVADGLADDTVADHAEAALELFGHSALEPLLIASRTAAPSLRGATLSMLPQLATGESESLGAVREALAETAAEVLAPALKSIAIIGGPADLRAVAAHVKSADAKIAAAAHGALLAVAGRHPDAARAMTARTNPRGEHALAATIILDALARAGASREGDAEFLASALTHRDAMVRRAAIDALARSPGEATAEKITLSLADEEPDVVAAAIRALGRLGRAEQLASLAATTRDPMRLATVLRALADADSERAFAAARPLLASSAPVVAAAAVEVIAAMPHGGRADERLRRTVDALMRAADHPDDEIVKLALAHLANSGDERALAALARSLDHAQPSVRRYAAELLGQEGSSEGKALLRARLHRERDADVRRGIMEALAARSPHEDAE